MKRIGSKLLVFITLAAFTLSSVNVIYYMHLPCNQSSYCQNEHTDSGDHNSNSKHDPDKCPICQHHLYCYGKIITEPSFSISFTEIIIGTTTEAFNAYESQTLCIARSRSPPLSHFI